MVVTFRQVLMSFFVEEEEASFYEDYYAEYLCVPGDRVAPGYLQPVVNVRG